MDVIMILACVSSVLLSTVLTKEITEADLKKLAERLPGMNKPKPPFLAGLELDLIVRSNIRRFLPFMDIRLLAVLCIGIFVFTYGRISQVLNSAGSSAAIAGLAACVPVFALDMMRKYNAQAVRTKLAEFISVLARWCSVREDIFYAFEKSIESGIGEPLRSYVRDMLIRVRTGLDPMEAMDMLAVKADNPHFRDFIVNIKQNIKSKGDIVKLMASIEEQFYRMKGEMEKRRISTFKDRMIVYVIMAVTAGLGWYMLSSNKAMELFYSTSSAGKSLLTLITVLFACGVWLTVKLNDFDY